MGALNEIPVEETQDLILQEAQKILRGETMMPPTRKHLEALGGLNTQLLAALKEADYRLTYFASQQQGNPKEYAITRGILAEVRAAIQKAKGGQ